MIVGLFGANGRMGKEIKLILDELGCECVAFCGDFEKVLNTDVVIDFSSKEGTLNLLKNHLNLKSKTPLVIGTTGLDDSVFDTMKSIDSAVFYSSNTSLGVAVLNKLVKEATKLLNGFDIEIVEAHHRHKKDAPSGTAISLFNSVKSVKNNAVAVYERHDKNCVKNSDDVGIYSIRGGDVAGRHVVGYYGDGEYIELLHNATSRKTFAKGAVSIAFWLNNQPSGFYEMEDFINSSKK